jgi:hypothetical protein
MGAAVDDPQIGMLSALFWVHSFGGKCVVMPVPLRGNGCFQELQ